MDEIHRARLLGVREAHRGEGAVRLLLLGDGVEAREARGLDSAASIHTPPTPCSGV